MDIYTQAFQTAAASKVFMDKIGEPYTVKWPITLRAGVSDAGNDAAFAATVNGPHGKGILSASGEKDAGRWHLTHLYLEEPTTHRYVSLLPSPGVEASVP